MKTTTVTKLNPKKHADQGGTPVVPLKPRPSIDAEKFHPAALAFPEMPPAELQELADDIRQHGLRESIACDPQGMILDGRNRLKACEIAGIESRFETYEGEPIAFIVSKNLKRRQLNESQRAMVAARLATLAHGANQAPSGKFAERPEALKQAAAAAMLNISERSIRNAAVVRDHGTTDLICDVEQGRISVSAAAKRARPPRPSKRRTKPASPDLKIAPNAIIPLKAAFREVEESSTVAELRAALQRLAKTVAKTLERLEKTK